MVSETMISIVAGIRNWTRGTIWCLPTKTQARTRKVSTSTEHLKRLDLETRMHLKRLDLETRMRTADRTRNYSLVETTDQIQVDFMDSMVKLSTREDTQKR